MTTLHTILLQYYILLLNHVDIRYTHTITVVGLCVGEIARVGIRTYTITHVIRIHFMTLGLLNMR